MTSTLTLILTLALTLTLTLTLTPSLLLPPYSTWSRIEMTRTGFTPSTVTSATYSG